MVDIARGVTFFDSGAGTYATMTSDLLFSLVASATVSNVSWDEIVQADTPYHTSDATPAAGLSAGIGTMWYDTTTDLLRCRRFKARWDPPNQYLHIVNESATVTMESGSLFTHNKVTDGVPTVEWSSEALYPEIEGVAVGHIEPGGAGLGKRLGWADVRVSCPVTAGDLLVSSAATGVADPTGGGATFGVAIGQCFTNISGAGVTTVTCMLWL